MHLFLRSFFARSFLLGVLVILGAAAPALAQTSDSAANPAAVVVRDEMRIEPAVDSTGESVGWNIFDAERLVAGYQTNSNGKPVVYPVIGPSGSAMTRRYPIAAPLATENDDHPHQRSMWFSHGDVNGFDFWADPENDGNIVEVSAIATTTDDGVAVLVTQNEWISPAGTRVLSDTRRFAFYRDRGRRIIDVDLMMRATDGDVTFGDTKEGSFGMRVAGTMAVDADLGGVITSADGATNSDAWGKSAKWVDYSGPVDDQTVGITIHDHPSSFGYPCRWHVRTYGLFAANPFGFYHFTGGPKTSGTVLKDGLTMRVNYRVVLHDGGLDADVANQDNADYANDPRPTLPSPWPLPQ